MRHPTLDRLGRAAWLESFPHKIFFGHSARCGTVLVILVVLDGSSQVIFSTAAFDFRSNATIRSFCSIQ